MLSEANHQILAEPEHLTLDCQVWSCEFPEKCLLSFDYSNSKLEPEIFYKWIEEKAELLQVKVTHHSHTPFSLLQEKFPELRQSWQKKEWYWLLVIWLTILWQMPTPHLDVEGNQIDKVPSFNEYSEGLTFNPFYLWYLIDWPEFSPRHYHYLLIFEMLVIKNLREQGLVNQFCPDYVLPEQEIGHTIPTKDELINLEQRILYTISPFATAKARVSEVVPQFSTNGYTSPVVQNGRVHQI